MAAVSIGIALWRRDELPIILSLLAGYLIPVVILGIPNFRILGKASGLSENDRFNVLKIGLAGIVTAPMFWMISSLDRWFLGYFKDAATVGVYSIGYNLAITGMMMNQALMAVWLPEASREYEQNAGHARSIIGANTSRLIVLLGLVWMGVVAAGGDIVRLLTDSRYHAAAQFVPYIAGGVFFYGVCQLAFGILILKQKLNLAIWWWLAGGAICCVLNSLLIPIYSGLGAAITQNVSFAFIGIGVFATSVKIFELDIAWTPLVLALGITFFSGIMMAGAWNQVSLLSLLLKLPIGIAISAVAVRVAAPGLLSKATDYCAGLARG
jgi:O-antigen/teichoic acid export membrane protein